jgi:hypothetical protein
VGVLNVVPRRLLLVLVALAGALWAASASATTADEEALAQKYAPVVRLASQDESCGPGEPYQPLDVDLLFGEPTVALMGPWGRDLVASGPSAEETVRLWRSHLDFPGPALDPGCEFEEWQDRIAADSPPTTYAHVTSQAERPGKLALQYWFFYVYNDWNNLHEGDWEMIQLVFDADDAREALAEDPVFVGYSQHEGAERADWGDEKLTLVDGTHPVVHPAAGSHANFFTSSLYLGSARNQGVGCDDTRGPHNEVRPVVATIPNDPAEARARYAWIEWEGRWGELQPAFFNGPTGPNMKRQWTRPMDWADELRDRSYAVPASGAFGTDATDFFCGAIAGGSRVLQKLLLSPAIIAGLLIVLALLIGWIVRRTKWRPSTPLRVARRRRWGQILTASGRMYGRRPSLFVGIGLLFIPVAIVVTLLHAAVFHTSSVLGARTDGSSGSLLVLAFFAIGLTLTLSAVGFVQAATVRALVELDAGRDIGALQAFRMATRAIRPLAGAFLTAILVVVLLGSTVFLIPVAVWVAVRWALTVPVVEVEQLPAFAALHRSSRLVRGRWLRVASLTTVGAAVALALGPFLGALLILLTPAPFWLMNVLSGLVLSLTIPYVALTTAYTYFDARIHGELEREAGPDVLPAEVELHA